MNVGKDTLVALDGAGLSISNKWLVRDAVSYTHLTLPTILRV